MAQQFGARCTAGRPGRGRWASGVAPAGLALALLIGAMPAFAEGSGSTSMPGTAGIHPGSVSEETVDGTKTRDTGTAGTAGTAYPGSGGGAASNPLGTNPLTGGVTNPTGGQSDESRRPDEPRDGDQGR